MGARHGEIQYRAEDGGPVWDTVPVDMAGIRDLRIELARSVGDLLKDHADKIWVDEDWSIDVTEKTGPILYVMHISATDSAATIPPRR